MTTFSRLLLGLILTTSLGCSFGIGISNKGFAAYWTLIDLRVGYKTANAGDVELTSDKEAMSKEQAKMWENLVPDIAAAVVEQIKPAILRGQQCSVPMRGEEVESESGNPAPWAAPGGENAEWPEEAASSADPTAR